MKKISYSATFSDGVMLARSSHREYAAAWRFSGTVTMSGRTWAQSGFSRTRELAAKALRDHTAWDGIKVTFAEVTDARREV